jgi:cyclohexyl-isocyanide hydratase
VWIEARILVPVRSPMSKTGFLIIGGVIFEDMDQADFTGPFEVLSRVPDSTFHVIAKTSESIRDVKGLVLTPTVSFSQSPQLDVLLVPGGNGVNTLMEDEEVLNFLRHQAVASKVVLSVCTGALLCGAAGLLEGKRATTHWASHNLLSLFGAMPVDARVVQDGFLVSAAGVTSGIDAALWVAAILRGDEVAQEIQLYIQYAPEPPFNCGSPESAPASVVEATRASMRSVLDSRNEIARRAAARLRTKAGL